LTRALAITGEKVKDYIAARQAKGDPPSSINRITEKLGQSYKLAKLPAPAIPHLSEKGNARKGFFSQSEVLRVMSNLPQDVADFTEFAWLTGMRKGEIASLRWSDIQDDVVVLRAENAKNDEARSIPLEGQLLELIERRRRARHVKVNGAIMLCDLIFHREGVAILEFRKSWATACRLAGVKRLFHDLRRSAVRDMIRAHVPQSVAMSISGHKTPSMFDRYNITDTTDQRKALADTQLHRQKQAEQQVAAGVAASRPN
jgi:integrase